MTAYRREHPEDTGKWDEFLCDPPGRACVDQIWERVWKRAEYANKTGGPYIIQLKRDLKYYLVPGPILLEVNFVGPYETLEQAKVAYLLIY